MIGDLLAKLGEDLHLVTPPGAALRVLEKASDPNCSFDDLGKLINHDPVLCGKLLKTVNSALFSPPATIVSVHRAVHLLGLRSVRALVLSLSLPAVGRRGSADGIARDFWKNAVTGAIIARELAVQLGEAAPDEDMVAGLLRDLGMTVFYQVYPEEYKQLLAVGPETLAQRQCELEVEQFGVHHAQVSAALLKRWRLPDDMAESIAFHHQPTLAQGCPERAVRRAALLHFGDAVTQLQATACCPAQLRYVLKLAQQTYGINLIQLSEFLHPLADKIAALAAVLDVDVGVCNDLGAVLQRAAQEAQSLTAAADVARWLSAEGPGGTVAGSVPEADGALGCAGPAETAALCPELARHPRYRILAQLGAGGTGTVYKAEHQLMRRLVALKVINRALIRDEATVERFQQEIRAAARLAHPNIVTAHDADQAGDVHFFVMEYVEGVSLARLVARHGPLPVADACHFIREAALGLQHAYEQGMVHRDIKPHNLMVTRKGQLKVLDFGLACLADPGRPGSGPAAEGLGGGQSVVGTPDFIAPEQARNSGSVDIRADLYSLGCTLYFLLTGRAPFAGSTELEKLVLHWQATAQPVESIRRDVPAGLAALVHRLMTKRPEQRCQTPAELVEALTPWARLTLPVAEFCEPEPGVPPSQPRTPDESQPTPPPDWRSPLQPTRIGVPGAVAATHDDSLSAWSLAGAAGLFLLTGSLSYWAMQSKEYGKQPKPEPRNNVQVVGPHSRGE